jgi:hypothetical protein
MTWTAHQISTITDETIKVAKCGGIEIKLDDLDLKSNATIFIPDDAWIEHVTELFAGGIELTIGTGEAEITLVLPFSPQLLDNTIQAHLRGEVEE